MAGLVQDLLTYSRLGTRGKQAKRIDAEKALVTAPKDQMSAIQEAGATFTHDPLPTLWADETQFGQLFTNLISNSLKFRKLNEPLPIHVAVDRQPPCWRFSIRDNGIGLDPKDADKIFLMFYRLHQESAYPGTGVGLAICKKIVEQHGGRIWVESEPGKGSTFFFTIPDRDAQPA